MICKSYFLSLSFLVLADTFRVARCLQEKPNAAHHTLASLSIPLTCTHFLHLSDPDQPPLFITQNFDSLSPHALDALGQLSNEKMKVA
jgi:NAD+-dependent protein deacetylase sirtuin 5